MTAVADYDPFDTTPATKQQRKHFLALLDRLATEVDWQTKDTQATSAAIDHLNRARKQLGLGYVEHDVNDQEEYFNWLIRRMRNEADWTQLQAFQSDNARSSVRRAAALMGIEEDG